MLDAAEKIKKFTVNTKKSASRLETRNQVATRIDLLQKYWLEFDKAFKLARTTVRGNPTAQADVLVDYDGFEEEYIFAMGELKDMLDALEPQLNGQHDGESHENARNVAADNAAQIEVVRMKAIDPPIFFGEIEDWTSFRDMFQSVVINNKSISDVQRLQYLKTSCKGKAAELIKHVQVTAANFAGAWAALTKRYENNRLLVSRLIEKLLELPAMKRECPIELARLLDGTNQVKQALTALKRPVEHWDDWLVVQTTTKLDYATRLAWEKSIGSTVNMPTFEELDDHLSGVLRSFEAVQSSVANTHNQPTGSTSNVRRTVRAHVVETRDGCLLCNGSHGLFRCSQFLGKTIAQRRAFIESSGICFNCISTTRHVSRQCPSRFRCLECQRHHHTLLHTNDEQLSGLGGSHRSTQENRTTRHNVQEASSTREGGERPNRKNPFDRKTGNESVSCNYSQAEQKEVVLLATAWVNARYNGKTVHLRALIDQGSQASFITEDAVQRLGAVRRSTNIGVTGIGQASPGKSYGAVDIQVSSCWGMSRQINITTLILPKITRTLPSQPMKQIDWAHLNSLPMADKNYGRPGRIDLLLGADCFAEVLLSGVRLGGRNEPVAQQTIFGWVVSGKLMAANETSSEVTSMHVQLDDMLQRFWHQEEVQQKSAMSTDDETCEQIFNEKTTRGSDGKYIVELPFRIGDRQLGDSRSNAIKRLLQMEKKGEQNGEMFEKYKEFMKSYHSLGHMEQVAAHEIDVQPHCYLPHHAVFKPESTSTKLRVVFDATLATSNGKGLNSLLLTGPRLQETLASILMRWRKHKIVFSADIEKMYRQIWVARKHQDYQRIVWRDDTSEPIKHFRLKTVTYGTASAPYMAIKTIQRLANDEMLTYPRAAKILKNDFYVDDCLSGADTDEDAIEIKNELLQIMQAGGLRLLKWSSNSRRLMETLPSNYRECRAELEIEKDETIKALGIKWHPATDEIAYKVKESNRNEAKTKRQILSEIAALFDPLGLLAPIMITAKILMQQLWLTGLGWDDTLPEETRMKWRKFEEELTKLQEVRIGRWFGYDKTIRTIQLHGFSDASQLAYAACVYVRTTHSDGTVSVTLLAAKTKVAPIKQQSIPRLELNGAVLLSKLIVECKQSIQCGEIDVFAWTDSTVVLAWLRRHANVWPTFIANRVSEIQQSMNHGQWRHVRGTDNPADVASRGIMPAAVMTHHLWWTGPTWLRSNQSEWPQQQELVVDESLLEERKNVTCHIVQKKEMWELTRRFSSWTKLLRITAYCRRIIRANRKADVVLDADEVEQARRVWIRLAQLHDFGDTERQSHDLSKLRKTTLRNLAPFVDEEGLLRVGGRLQNADLMYDEMHPYILHGRNDITQMIIKDAHERMFHGGPQITMGRLHQRYWILQERRQVRGIIHKCITCAKARPKAQHQQMGSLPIARVNASRAFLHTAVDYAGPIWSRTSKGRGQKATKSWIAVFVCLSTKAIHLELVSDLSTAAFIAAFKRFTARRGLCSDIYSDNGTNFVGADRELRKQLGACMKDSNWRNELSTNGTRFHFAPPGSPHFNGLAESSVKMVKSPIRKILGESKLTFEEMSTFLTQVEAILNSRPLCTISRDGVDDNVLTPGHFLIGQPLNAVPEPNTIDHTQSPATRWALIQRLVQQFWRRWGREYLHQMQQRTKWQQQQPNIEVGDVVLVHDELLHPTKWKMGRVLEVHPGSDGAVRVATVKCEKSAIKRAIAKLSVLPVV